jgi:hypothetical protein
MQEAQEKRLTAQELKDQIENKQDFLKQTVLGGI